MVVVLLVSVAERVCWVDGVVYAPLHRRDAIDEDMDCLREGTSSSSSSPSDT